jgi:hypothetical protein
MKVRESIINSALGKSICGKSGKVKEASPALSKIIVKIAELKVRKWIFNSARGKSICGEKWESERRIAGKLFSL